MCVLKSIDIRDRKTDLIAHPVSAVGRFMVYVPLQTPELFRVRREERAAI